MTEKKKAKSKTDEPKRLSFTVSAKIINALSPLIHQVQEMKFGEAAFFNQVDTQRFGIYVIPESEGVIVAVVDNVRMIAVRDPEGRASEAVRVYFPSGLLDTIKPRLVTLVTEDASSFQIESPPFAHRIFGTEMFGLVSIDAESEAKWKGGLGSWFNGDHGNVRDMSTWRTEAADVSFISHVVGLAKERKAAKAIMINPALLAPVADVARALDVTLEIIFADTNGSVVLRSARTNVMWGLIMPLGYQERKDAHQIEVSLSPKAVTKKRRAKR